MIFQTFNRTLLVNLFYQVETLQAAKPKHNNHASFLQESIDFKLQQLLFMTCTDYLVCPKFLAQLLLQVHFLKAGSAEKMAETIDVMCFSLGTRFDYQDINMDFKLLLK